MQGMRSPCQGYKTRPMHAEHAVHHISPSTSKIYGAHHLCQPKCRMGKPVRTHVRACSVSPSSLKPMAACRFAHETLQEPRFMAPYVDSKQQTMSVRGSLWPPPEQLARCRCC